MMVDPLKCAKKDQLMLNSDQLSYFFINRRKSGCQHITAILSQQINDIKNYLSATKHAFFYHFSRGPPLSILPIFNMARSFLHLISPVSVACRRDSAIDTSACFWLELNSEGGVYGTGPIVTQYHSRAAPHWRYTNTGIFLFWCMSHDSV